MTRTHRRSILPLCLAALMCAGVILAAAAGSGRAAPQTEIQSAAAAPSRTGDPAPHEAPAAIELPVTVVPYPAQEPIVKPGVQHAEAEERSDTEDVPPDLELLDTFIATAYCVTGTTATGTYTTEHRTLAVNPGVIPYGTHVWLFLDDGTLVGDFYAEDTGTNMMEHPYVVDIYMGPSYDACVQWGARHVSVWVEPEA